MKLSKFLAGCCLAGCLIQPLAVFSQEQAGDDTFMAARDAFRLGNRPRLEALTGQLQGYVLVDYASYYLLRQGLEKKDAATVQAFIDSQEGNYLAERTRADWLKVLADRGEWSELSRQYALLRSPDQESRCLGLQARLARKDGTAQADAEAVWLSLSKVPEGCEGLMDSLSTQVTSDTYWARVHLLFEANQVTAARQLLQALPASQRPDARQLTQVVDKPAPWLVKQSSAGLKDRGDREMIALAIQRLARNDPGFAAGQLERWGQYLGAPERTWAWGQIGVQAARRHMDEALGWYDRGDASQLSEDAAEWRVRSALRLKDWGAVRTSIESLPKDLQDKPDWTYWLGRAYKAGGRLEEARQLFARIAGQPHFYGNLADEELGHTIGAPRGQKPGKAEVAAMGRNPGLARALAFFRLDLRTEAIREWNWTIRDMDDRQLLAAAELALENQIYDRAINTADKTREQHDFAMRFLAPFEDQVRPAAKEQSLDDAWVYGLMRQESRFITHAKSSVGASGLMQLMPATARWVAKKIGLQDYDHRRVTEPEINLLLGTSYMRMVMEDLDNHPVLASAAYNAGPGRARRWRASIPLEGAIYAETIPFTETRDYVKKVMSNAVYYSVLFNGRPASLRDRLGVVPAKPAVDAPKTPDLP